MKNEINRRAFVSRLAGTCLGVSVIPPGLAQAADSEPAKATAKRVIFINLKGGMSHIDTFDPKPDRPDVQGPVKAIKTNVTGIRISEYLPLMARQLDKVAIIRSMSSTQGAHEQGQYFLHTSYAKRGTIVHPSLGSWTAKTGGRLNKRLPANIRINGGSGGGGAGFLETRYAPLEIGDPSQGLVNSKRPKHIDESKFKERLALTHAFDQNFHRENPVKEVRAYKDVYREALKLMKSEDLKAFDISRESKAKHAAYGEHKLGQGCLLARRLVEHDVRYVEVNSGGWDTHTANFSSLEEKVAELDQALSTLLKDLSSKGMLEETLVVLATEFGRTPKINENDGRDHSPTAYSGLLAGGGISGGQVYGKTDETGKFVDGDEVTVPDFNATIAHALGLPRKKQFFSPSGRPFMVAHKGKAQLKLFS
jgi:uncharacterized protein (DUF1501 family)